VSIEWCRTKCLLGLLLPGTIYYREHDGPINSTSKLLFPIIVIDKAGPLILFSRQSAAKCGSH
jgi:hypothetical protein